MERIARDLRARIRASGFSSTDRHNKDSHQDCKSTWMFLVYDPTGQVLCARIRLNEPRQGSPNEFSWSVTPDPEHPNTELPLTRMVMLTEAKASKYPWYHPYYKAINEETA